MKKKTLVPVMVLTSILSLAGCNNGGNSSNEKKGHFDHTVTIKFTQAYAQGYQAKLQAFVDSFKEIEPNVEIKLEDGFHALQGADFVAHITPCEYSSKDSDSVNYTSSLFINDGKKTEEIPDQAQGITIYPNPNKGAFYVGLSDRQDAVQQIAVFGILGNQVMAESNPQNGVVDVSHLSPGIYVVKVLTNKGEVYFEKIVKE